MSSENANYLDLSYFYNRSYSKTISPLVENLINDQVENYVTLLASIIINEFKVKWNKIYDALNENQYDVNEDYRITIDRTINNSLETNTISNYNETTKIYGFNSNQGVNSNSSNGSSETEEKGSKLGNEGELHETRSGLTGNRTNQSMIKDELNLRYSFNILQEIYRDVDSILTRGTYQ